MPYGGEFILHFMIKGLTNFWPNILQLSGKNDIFIVDLDALSHNQKLDEILSDLFMNNTIIGFAF